MAFDIDTIRAQFPIFQRPTPLGQPLTYLDSAATSQKPQVVIDALVDFYQHFNANIGRGSYWPASAATQAYEDARQQVAHFLRMPGTHAVVFTSGTTDAINKVARSFLLPRLRTGDEVVITEMEHHANLVPWQQLCLQAGAILRVVPLGTDGRLDMHTYSQWLGAKTRMVALTAVSNTLGLVNDVQTMTRMAHDRGIPVLVDAAQAVAHQIVDVGAIDCDFLVFSGHKMYGPTGIGVLCARKKLLDDMPPVAFGGGMVRHVTFGHTGFAPVPQRHEAGTPPIAGAIGLQAAIVFLEAIGMDAIHQYLSELTSYAVQQIEGLHGVTVLNRQAVGAPLFSFVIDGIHPHDIAGLLNESGIAVRAGHHCTQPLMEAMGVAATTRISFGVYNTTHDVDRLVVALQEAMDFFG